MLFLESQLGNTRVVGRGGWGGCVLGFKSYCTQSSKLLRNHWFLKSYLFGYQHNKCPNGKDCIPEFSWDSNAFLLSLNHFDFDQRTETTGTSTCHPSETRLAMLLKTVLVIWDYLLRILFSIKIIHSFALFNIKTLSFNYSSFQWTQRSLDPQIHCHWKPSFCATTKNTVWGK